MVWQVWPARFSTCTGTIRTRAFTPLRNGCCDVGDRQTNCEIDRELATGNIEGDRQWYVNGQGQTLVVIRGPVEFEMGSPSR